MCNFFKSKNGFAKAFLVVQECPANPVRNRVNALNRAESNHDRLNIEDNERQSEIQKLFSDLKHRRCILNIFRQNSEAENAKASANEVDK